MKISTSLCFKNREYKPNAPHLQPLVSASLSHCRSASPELVSPHRRRRLQFCRLSKVARRPHPVLPLPQLVRQLTNCCQSWSSANAGHKTVATGAQISCIADPLSIFFLLDRLTSVSLEPSVFYYHYYFNHVNFKDIMLEGKLLCLVIIYKNLS